MNNFPPIQNDKCPTIVALLTTWTKPGSYSVRVNWHALKLARRFFASSGHSSPNGSAKPGRRRTLKVSPLPPAYDRPAATPKTPAKPVNFPPFTPSIVGFCKPPPRTVNNPMETGYD